MGRVLEFDDDDWEWTMETNLRQNFLLFKAAGAQMKQQGTGGSMIAVASVDGFFSSRLHVAYGAAKAGLISMIKTFAEELGPHGIRVNGVAPGGVGTGNEGEGESEFGADPMSPLAKPRTRDISNAIVFFEFNLSERITGQTIPVDGGATTKAPLMYADDNLEWAKKFSVRAEPTAPSPSPPRRTLHRKPPKRWSTAQSSEGRGASDADWGVLGVVCLSQLMVVVDISVVNVGCRRSGTTCTSPSRACSGS